MKHICFLENTVQPYAWGSYTAIPKLLGEKSESVSPQAELWMGAHPKAPSMVILNGRLESLEKLINQHPIDILGRKVAQQFKNELPYLFKVLAAAKPLSLQAHPSASQAQEGYKRENGQGIPLDSPQRNYKDPNHKPECICALTPFWALHGFREIPEIITLADHLQINSMEPFLNILKSRPDEGGLKSFFRQLMTLSADKKKHLALNAADNANKLKQKNDVYRWIKTLSESYPEDIGVLSPLYLNLVRLEPGQALFLPAAELHAYLEGVGIELMANSDNVLRGGLTPKHIDVAELIEVLDFGERVPNLLTRQPGNVGELVYVCPAKEFALSVIQVNSDTGYTSPRERSVEILLCTAGTCKIKDLGSRKEMALKKGHTVIVPAAAFAYSLNGNATIYKAAVPI
jgi:mannose-6-phosphate isomerase